ncbi:hypothetical protein MHU86_19774 [Fragilaria crotonensis]|nr:hypothetical protein MHU86_19774 [Fragilaria crotonensis]
MARRTHGAEPGRDPDLSKKAGTQPAAVHSMGTGGGNRSASKAAPGHGATSMARSLTKDQYGPNENTATPAGSTTSEACSLTAGDQYGPQHGATPPVARADMAHKGSGIHSTKGGNQYRKGRNPASETTFMANAASARRSRLRYEGTLQAARSAEVAVTTGAVKKETSQPKPGLAKLPTYQTPESTDKGEGPNPSGHLTTSAAERVRSVLSPAARLKQRQTNNCREPMVVTKGEERNAKRLRESDVNDRETLGRQPGFWRQSRRSVQHPRRCPQSPNSVRGLRGCVSAQRGVTESFDFDLGRLIQAFDSSTIGFGSEFRKVSELRPLIGRHPHFPRLETLLTEGMQYVFDRELSSQERGDEVTAMLARGNHKLAQQEQDRVGELLAKDVTHGFTIPIPIAAVQSIPGAMVQPLGLVQQWTVDQDGARKAKFRLTQDLSFSTGRGSEPTSINSRIDMSAYVNMVYGWCLPRIVHFIVALRSQNPALLILISKYDYSDAYRRIAHSSTAAAQTIAINGSTAFLSLRLTFGGSPNPPTWCMFSELVTDLANEIAQCDDWDPTEHRSPAQASTPEPLRLPAHVPIVQARRMAINIPPTKAGGRVDGFIDDLINVFLDTPANCLRQPHIVPLAMHLTSRPHAGDEHEPIPRRPILSIPKLIAEGRPEEVQIVLGWRINTRLLEISYPTTSTSPGLRTSGNLGPPVIVRRRSWRRWWDG